MIFRVPTTRIPWFGDKIVLKAEFVQFRREGPCSFAAELALSQAPAS